MKSKEERFKELINDILIGEYSVQIILDGQYKNIDFYNKEGLWLIHYNQKNEQTWICYDKIWYIFEKEYNMNYLEIQSFMNDMLLKHFKIKGTTPKRYFFINTYLLVEKIQN